MKLQNMLTSRQFFRVWALYGSMFAGAVGTAVLIALAALFTGLELLRSAVPQLYGVIQGRGFLSSFDEAMSSWLEHLGMSLGMLFIVWLLLALSAVIPATLVGIVYELLNKYLCSETKVLTVTYGLAALISAAYGNAAFGLQYDGMPLLFVPMALATALIACKLTLRFRSDVLEPKKVDDAAKVDS